MRVPIVGIGARTPVGYRAAPTAAAIRCEIRRIELHPFMVDSEGEPVRLGLDHGLEDKQTGAIRMVVMGRSALREALAQSRNTRDARIDVLLALPETRPGFSAAAPGWIAKELAAGLVEGPVELVARGHAGALDAIREAATRIEDGRSELCAVVGVDSYIQPETIDWLDAQKRLGGGSNPDGFVPGEAGACIVLANASLGLKPLGFVRGAHSSRESVRIQDDDEVLGIGLTEAIRGATSSLRLPDDGVEDVFCDLNGERYRTDEWSFALLRTSGTFRSTEYTVTCSCTGDVGAATGPLGCILAIRSWARGYGKGTRALVCGGSEGGLRSAVLLEESPAARELPAVGTWGSNPIGDGS